MGLTTPHLRRLADGPALSRVADLSFADEAAFGNDGVRVLAAALPPTLVSLRMERSGGQADGLEVLTRSENLTGLRRLDLSRNALAPRAARVLAASRVLAGLRALDLRDCRVGDKGVRHLTRAKFWANLVELDLRGNPMSAAGVRHLLDAAVPADLAALVLSGDQFGAGGRAELRRKYADRVVFAAG
jgi:Ran GTPase-activating protein (RanGAP) involved in mRNA processing and transport